MKNFTSGLSSDANDIMEIDPEIHLVELAYTYVGQCYCMHF